MQSYAIAGLYSVSGIVTTANLFVSVPVPWVRLIATIGTALSGVNLNSYKSRAVLPSFANKIATYFASSIGEPPPIPITALAPNSLPSFVAASTSSATGFGVISA